MKRKSRRTAAVDPESVAVEVLGRLADDPERLGRFLSLTGISPAGIRSAASDPGFLAAVLDHVASDEPLLLAIAGELDTRPEVIVAAQARLSPPSDWSP